MAGRIAKILVVCTGMALATGGCSRYARPTLSGPQRPAISFEAARAQCGVTVAETIAVQRCMRAQGWAYRLPWQ